MTQLFDTVDVLRVQVEDDPTGLINLVTNPRGERGGSGWISPVPGARIQGFITGGTQALQFLSVATLSNYYTTEAMPVAAGRWYRARWFIASPSGSFYRVKVEHLDAAEEVISTNTLTGWLADTTASPSSPAAAQAPVGTVTVRLRFDHASSNTGENFSSPALLYVHTVSFVEAATAAGTSGAIPPIPFVSITGSVSRIGISRAELDLGVLEADIVDANLDPAKGSIIRPGKRVQVQALVSGTWRNLIVGQIVNGSTAYDFTKPAGKRATIRLTASDGMAQLANRKRSEGVASIDDLPHVLEGTGVQWSVNGFNGQVGGASVVAVNDNASAVDQVALTRDTALGYAWLNRDGVLVAYDPGMVPTAPGSVAGVAVLDEANYRSPDFGFDTSRCINEVAIVVVATIAGETTETTFGPYRDVASISRWGRRAETFTVYDKSESEVKAHAASILAANGTPVMRCASLVMPIATTADLPKTVIDLYDVLTVQNTVAEFDDDLRVVGVAHEITATKWMVTLTFAGVGSVAPSQMVPSPSLSPLNLEGIGNTVMAYGTAAQVVANNPGHLIADGSAYGGVSAYPKLHAHLTAMVAAGVHTDANLLPSMTDRFPIAAGVKAVGSQGGSPTKTLTNANADATQATGGYGLTVTGAFANRVLVNDTANPPTPLDVMPPWRALYFLIRAA